MGKEGSIVKAYVLAVVELGQDHEIAEKIKELDHSAKITTDLVFGEYDLVAVIETDSIKKLDRIITQIRKLDGVLKTITLIAS